MTPAATPPPTGERSRVVWWAHVARASAALAVLFARFMYEFREQKRLVTLFTFDTPLTAAQLPTSFALSVYRWPVDHLKIELGYAAVGMFFMLSGFVIPFTLEKRNMRAFGIRRFFRLYPTLWVATALSILVIWLTTRGHSFPLERAQVFTSGTVIAQYSGKNWIDPSYWTIPIEELFYLTAALLAVTRLLRRPTVLVGTVAVVTAVSVVSGRVLPPVDHAPDAVFWARLYIGRNLAFMIFVWTGVALHMLYRRFWTRRTFVIVLTLIVGMFYFAVHHGPFQKPWQLADSATIYFNSFLAGMAIFLALYLIGDRIPRSQPVQTLGDVSYPVYLTVTVIGWTILAWLTRSFGSYFWALPVAAAMVLGIAYLLHKLVEKPTYAIAQRITAQPQYRTDRSWSDPPRPIRWRRHDRSAPAAPRRKPRRVRPGYVAELDPDRAPEPLPEPASAMLGFDAAAPDGNGPVSAGDVSATQQSEPEPTG